MYRNNLLKYGKRGRNLSSSRRILPAALDGKYQQLPPLQRSQDDLHNEQNYHTDGKLGELREENDMMH